MRAPRYPTNEKAAVEIYGKTGTSLARLKNISRSGACIEWMQPDFAVQPGDLVRMTVKLNALNKSHNLSAEVVWKDGNTSGITFLTSDQVFERIIERT